MKATRSSLVLFVLLGFFLANCQSAHRSLECYSFSKPNQQIAHHKKWVIFKKSKKNRVEVVQREEIPLRSINNEPTLKPISVVPIMISSTTDIGHLMQEPDTIVPVRSIPEIVTPAGKKKATRPSKLQRHNKPIPDEKEPKIPVWIVLMMLTLLILILALIFIVGPVVVDFLDALYD